MDPEKPPSAETAQYLNISGQAGPVLDRCKREKVLFFFFALVQASEEFILGIWPSVDSSVDVCVTQNGIHLHPLALQVKWSEKQFPPLELTLSSTMRGSRSAGKHILVARENNNTFTLPYVENKPELSEQRNFRLDSGVMLTSLWNSLPNNWPRDCCLSYLNCTEMQRTSCYCHLQWQRSLKNTSVFYH